jgi:hypothetical protein
MKVVSICLMTGLGIGVAASAFAQSATGGAAGDIKYCNALARSYQGMVPAQEGMTASDVVILSKCESEPKSTIAVLEKKLTDKKIDLPHDDRIAQPAGSRGNSQ